MVCLLQINTASSGGTTSLAQLDFPAALTLPLTFTYTAGQTLGSSYTLSFTVIGVDADHYYTPSPITITLIPSYFTFSPASDTLYTSALSSNISVTPSHAPFTGGVSLSLINVNTSAGTFSSASLIFAAASTNPQVWDYIAPATSGVYIMTSQPQALMLHTIVSPVISHSLC